MSIQLVAMEPAKDISPIPPARPSDPVPAIPAILSETDIGSGHNTLGRSAKFKIRKSVQATDHSSLAKSNAQVQMRELVAKEILTTESTYVNSLRVLLEGIVKPAKAFLSEKELAMIFANLEELVELHSKFLDLLRARVTAWSPSAVLGDLFVKELNFAARYEPYLVGYTTSLIALRVCKNKYPEMDRLLKQFEEAQRAASMLSVEAFMVMPVQRFVLCPARFSSLRIPRYILLIRDFNKFSGETDDTKVMAQAASALDTELQRMNANINPQLQLQMKKVLDIANSIAGLELVRLELLSLCPDPSRTCSIASASTSSRASSPSRRRLSPLGRRSRRVRSSASPSLSDLS